MINCAMLYHVDYSSTIMLRTDASIVGMGVVLVNMYADGTEHVLWFLSRAFTSVEQCWSTIEQEAFAVFWAVTSLEHTLLGHPFIVETDHQKLVFMCKSNTLKVVRWRLDLQAFQFVIWHIPGKENVVALGATH